jgi:hypothetical protein
MSCPPNYYNNTPQFFCADKDGVAVNRNNYSSQDSCAKACTDKDDSCQQITPRVSRPSEVPLASVEGHLLGKGWTVCTDKKCAPLTTQIVDQSNASDADKQDNYPSQTNPIMVCDPQHCQQAQDPNAAVDPANLSFDVRFDQTNMCAPIESRTFVEGQPPVSFVDTVTTMCQDPCRPKELNGLNFCNDRGREEDEYFGMSPACDVPIVVHGGDSGDNMVKAGVYNSDRWNSSSSSSTQYR